MQATRRPQRTYDGLWAAGCAYHRLSEGGTLAPPEESLGVRRAPLEEGPFERASDLRMDFERGIRCPEITFQGQEITFAHLAGGGDDGSRDRVRHAWGISRGMVRKHTDRTLLAMVRHLNGWCKCDTGLERARDRITELEAELGRCGCR